jgi:hypothetical protein
MIARMQDVAHPRHAYAGLDVGQEQMLRDRKAIMMFPRISLQVTDADNPEHTVEEWHAWQWLRSRLKESTNPWSGRELAHLRFLRWLAQTGRLAEDGAPVAAEDGVRALEASGQ